ncbi:MAG: glycosyltransferase family 2 protein [Chloroflexi bacterium]|nr:glycosyltransferase family 2 protein [Chloroflexota bacterium]
MSEVTMTQEEIDPLAPVLADDQPSESRRADAPKIVAIVPVYNEERFIGSVVLKTKEYASTVLVVDDGSTDGTAAVAKAAGAEVIRHEQNQGKGAALNTGFHRARELAADAIVTLDGDGQHFPEELCLVIQPILDGQADIVVGSRYLENTSDVPQRRVWGHRFFNLITNQLSGVAVTDSQSGFRAFSRRALDALSLSSKGFSVESEMQFLASDCNLRVCEVPITIKYLDKPKRSVISQGLTVLGGILRLVGQHRPLLYFGVPGTILLAIGLIWGAQSISFYNQRQILSAGYVLVSTLLITLGALSFFAGLILHSIRGLLLDLLNRTS